MLSSHPKPRYSVKYAGRDDDSSHDFGYLCCCCTKIAWQHKTFGQYGIDNGCVVSLNEEEEYFFDGYSEYGRSDDGVLWVCPDAIADQIRIPWSGRHHSDLSIDTY